MYKKLKYRLKIIKILLPFTNGVKRFFVINFAISIMIMFLTFINPIFYKIFIDEVILGRNFNRIVIVIIGYLSIYFINVLFGYLKNYYNNRLVNRTLFRAKFKIWKGFLNLEILDYEKQSIGDMKMRIDDDANQIQSFSNYQTIDYIISYITLVFSLILLFFIEWRLALFSILTIPSTFLLDDFISKKERKLNDSNRENDEKMSSWLHISIQGWREIKALNLEKYQQRFLIRYLHKFALYYGKWINYWVMRVLVIPKVKDEFLMRFGLYFFGGLLIMNGKLEISNLFVFVTYYTMLSEAIRIVSSTDAELQASMPYTNRLIESLSVNNIYSMKNKMLQGEINSIILDKVCFKYENSDKEVLHDMNIQILKGDKVAIVGKSGCGKTTVLKLITGILKPTKGRILISNIDISDINMSNIHKRVGFVMQDSRLFNTTIRNNLLYGKDNATEEEIITACKKAYIYELIKTLPDGFDTIIGERGIKLSGGQRQRIILARLFLRDVDIFIFDEATSALDQYSENIVHDAIKNIAKDKIIIIVSHRQSSLDLCDKIIKIKGVGLLG